ncbi:hypothetical protein H1R20_g16100, partial [Candolleomyces eurysporus]
MARITRATFTLLYSLLALAQLSVAASVYEKRQESTDASDGADADVATVQTSTLRAGASYPFVCSIISGTTSSSTLVHWPGSPVFKWLSSHWAATSNQVPACVVEPGKASDIAKILLTVGISRTPFAVQSGGHTTNPGWSSTKGVHISLNSLRSINYDSASQTVEIGTGLRWEEVYAALEPHGVTVVGGRVRGVGVGGFTLGGGYSWKTNQYGLTIDTVTAFELVTPLGKVVKVTQRSDSALFSGLKGGGNNFGIVTKITLKTVPQGPVWGGSMTYMDPATLPLVNAATAKFAANVTDPKASILNTVSFYQGAPLVNIAMFYDGPSPPAGIFDDFLSIPAVAGGSGTQTYLEKINSSPSNDTYGFRNYFGTVPVPKYSPKLLDIVSNLSVTIGNELSSKSLVFMTLVNEPFLPSILSHSNSGATSYPWNRSKVYTPFNIFLSWADPAQDKAFEAAVKRIQDTLYAALAEEGERNLDGVPLYSNYAMWDTPVSKLYGPNLPGLKLLKLRVDPLNVMSLAGGFKI